MNKLGKLNKYINSDLKNFSKDKIRQAISNQDENLNISLKPEVSISQFSETYSPSEAKYVGSITFTAEPEIVQKINKLIIDSRPQETVNTGIIYSRNSDVSQEKLAELKRQLMGDTVVTDKIFSNFKKESLTNAKVLDLAKSIQRLRQGKFTPQNITDLLKFQTGQVPRIDLKLAGARESAKQYDLGDRINFRYRFSGRQARPEDSPFITDQPSQSTQNLTIKIGKSSLFYDTSGNPVTYRDFNFSVYKHFEEFKDITSYNPENISSENPPFDLRSADNLLKFKVKLEYNFLIKNYEEFLKDNPSVSILNLPYFYEILEFKISENPPPELSDYSGTSFLNKPENIVSLDGERNILKSLIVNSKLTANKDKAQLDQYLNKFNPFKEQFPFYSEIRISTHNKPQTNLSNLFHEYNLYSKFLLDIKDNLSQDSFYNKFPNNSAAFVNLDGYLFNENFIQSLFNSNIVTNPALFFKLNSVLANIKRNFKEIVSGISSHTEVVGYILQKYEKQSSTLLQEWYLPNIGEDYLEWIDTQIKLYDIDGTPQQYTYKLHLLVLSIGTMYEYVNPNNPDGEPIELNGNNITLYYKHQPQFTIFKIENSAQYTNFISDKPPVEPDVSIIPYIGIDNKIKFNLNSGIGKFDAFPVSKNDEEKKQIDIISTSQDRIDNKITFESDEPAEVFEIYRTDFKPRNYNDIFEGNLVSINTDGNTAASYDDEILPNTKYYYTVRCQDYHKNFSNPSKIFEVELINDNGTIFPNIQIVDFEKDEALKQDNKTFRRYLKISPSLIQKTIDPATVTKTSLKMGLSSDGVWNKNMKLRLISKQTGRKIDLKFKFKYDISNK